VLGAASACPRLIHDALPGASLQKAPKAMQIMAGSRDYPGNAG
jgi:hypothetical protein